jgi:hypothetical protein
MKLLLTAILLAMPISSQAQNDDWWKMASDKKKASTAPQPKGSTTESAAVDIKQRIKGFRNDRRFSVRYDKFRDDTLVSVGPFYVGGTKSYVVSGFQLEMTAYLFLDKEPVKYLYIRFHSSSRDWTFLKNSELLALVDGERMQFGEGDRDSDVRRGGVSESMVYAIPVERFEKMGRATSAELKIGSVELTLKDEHKEAFRNLLSLMDAK